MSKPLRIRLTRASGSYARGAEVGVASEAIAKKHFGDGYTIVGYDDGTPYEKKAKPAASEDAPTAAAEAEPDTTAEVTDADGR